MLLCGHFNASSLKCLQGRLQMIYNFLIVPFRNAFAVATMREDGSLNYLTSEKTKEEASHYVNSLADVLLIA